MNEVDERRLAAILVVDVVGYSRLMGADETSTLRRLKALRRELLDPRILGARGRIVKSTGDGLIAEFPSPVRAVSCAVAIQRTMLTREAGVSDDDAFRLRIGINLGDVVAEPDGDLFGDGINVAARLEPLAEPGGICISHTVHDQVRDKLHYPFEDRGKQAMKNIARPVGVFALSATAILAVPVETNAETETSIRTWPAARGLPGRFALAGGLLILTVLGGLGLWSWMTPREAGRIPPAALGDDRSGTDWIPAAEIRQKLLATGYTSITELKPDDGLWDGKGTKNGVEVRFHVDPRTGAILSEKADD
jgi:class 3 adenylate cyclase